MSRRRAAWFPLVAAAIGLALAGYLFRPWVTLPFDIWDFQEFVPLLRQSPDPTRQLAELLDYYAAHGRRNVLFYGTFVAQWQLFGEASLGWQLGRFALMAANVALTFTLLRRLGTTAFAAAAGAGLLIAGSPVLRGWVQLMAEPQVLLALLAGALLALRYQSTTHWKAAAAGLAVMVAIVVLSKEVLVVLAGLVVLLALCRRSDGSLRLPARSPRNMLLATMASLVVVLAAVMLWSVRQQPEATHYGMAYGQGALSVARFGELFFSSLLPFRTGADVRLGLVYPANLLFIGVVALGWVARLRPRESRRRVLTELGWFLAIPAIGALAYLPWPKYDSFYALPFFSGSVLLFACAVSALDEQRASARATVRVAAALAVAFLVLAGRRSVAVSAAALQVNVSLARNLKVFRSRDTVVIAGPRQGPAALPVQGDELRQYAIAMRYAEPAELPIVVDVDCEGGGRLLQEGLGRKVLVSYSFGCGSFPEPSARLAVEYVYRDWLTLKRIRDSAAADLLVPR